MRAGSSIKRYAKALVEVAAESGELERGGAGLLAFAEILRKSQELRAFFRNPSILLQEKKQVLEALAEEVELGLLVKAFLGFLLERGALLQLDSLCLAYEELKDERLGRLKGAVTSAVPLTGEEVVRLRERLERLAGKSVYLERKVDPSLLGGLVVQLRSTVYDGSLKTQLLRMKEQLLKT
ncbi:MAG: ATP synthase F1 subunit delta [Candidatus Methylomirabilales bacterium]